MPAPVYRSQVEFQQHLETLETGLADPKKWIATDGKGRIYVKKKWSKFLRFLLCIFDKISGGRIFAHVHADRVAKNLLEFCAANSKHIGNIRQDCVIRQRIEKIFDEIRDKTRNKKYKKSVEASKEKLSKIHNFCVICQKSTVFNAPSEYVKRETKDPHEERVLDCCENIFHNACLANLPGVFCPTCRKRFRAGVPDSTFHPDEMTLAEVLAVPDTVIPAAANTPATLEHFLALTFGPVQNTGIPLDTETTEIIQIFVRQLRDLRL